MCKCDKCGAPVKKCPHCEGLIYEEPPRYYPWTYTYPWSWTTTTSTPAIYYGDPNNTSTGG